MSFCNGSIGLLICDEGERVHGLSFTFLKEIHGGGAFAGAVVRARINPHAEDAT